MKKTIRTIIALAIVSLAMPVFAADPPVGDNDAGVVNPEALAKITPNKAPYSPYAGRNYPTRPLFGDTHLHTSYSFDAGTAGCRLGPVDALRFAKGEEIVSSTGQRVKLSRPLDFMLVADHSDGFSLFPRLLDGDPAFMADPTLRKWADMMNGGQGMEALIEIVTAQTNGTLPEVMVEDGFNPQRPGYRSAWHAEIQASEDANEPGRFTALLGYEWTSNWGGDAAGNLHRIVIFRGNADSARQADPMTTAKPWGSPDPRDLWKWMAAYEEKTHDRVLAIAHNGNLSNGRMFPIIESFTGKKIDRAYAENRARWEPLVEITQIKGTGEAHPALSPNDEFADYEIWDEGNLDISEAKKPEMLEFEYARSALKNGLKLEVELGVNPYKFGLIGATDSHTALASAEESNFFGKTSVAEPSAERWEHDFAYNPKLNLRIKNWETSAAGYAAVWATENTRAAIFDAMERRETYATTGPRMVVRFFGGFDFEAADANSRIPAKVGYTKGVPMGGDLTAAPKGKSISFLVAALKDPIGANLDRVQVIKGWLDKDGKTQERVYDVAVSDDRQIDADGRCKTPVGNTVDVPNATWTNTIGAGEMITVWTDPDFDPALRSFYYVRVIEIPTPRWTAYDSKYFGITMPKEVPMIIQERAYTSPIWYTP